MLARKKVISRADKKYLRQLFSGQGWPNLWVVISSWLDDGTYPIVALSNLFDFRGIPKALSDTHTENRKECAAVDGFVEVEKKAAATIANQSQVIKGLHNSILDKHQRMLNLKLAELQDAAAQRLAEETAEDSAVIWALERKIAARAREVDQEVTQASQRERHAAVKLLVKEKQDETGEIAGAQAEMDKANAALESERKKLQQSEGVLQEIERAINQLEAFWPLIQDEINHKSRWSNRIILDREPWHDRYWETSTVIGHIVKGIVMSLLIWLLHTVITYTVLYIPLLIVALCVSNPLSGLVFAFGVLAVASIAVFTAGAAMLFEYDDASENNQRFHSHTLSSFSHEANQTFDEIKEQVEGFVAQEKAETKETKASHPLLTIVRNHHSVSSIHLAVKHELTFFRSLRKQLQPAQEEKKGERESEGNSLGSRRVISGSSSSE